MQPIERFWQSFLAVTGRDSSTRPVECFHFDRSEQVADALPDLVLPFREVTFDLCRREGEDDTLASWQRGHVSFFTAEGRDGLRV